MADQKISELPAATTVFATDEFPVNNDVAGTPTTRKMTLQQMLAGPRREFSNTSISVAVGDRLIAQTGTMTAARTVTLPLANLYPAGTRITIVDESDTVTLTNNIVILTSAGILGAFDTINMNTFDVITTGCGFRIYETNGNKKWTIIGGSEEIAGVLAARVTALETQLAALQTAFDNHNHDLQYDAIGTASDMVSAHAMLANPHLGAAHDGSTGAATGAVTPHTHPIPH